MLSSLFSPEFQKKKKRFELDMENCLQSYEQIISVVETYSIQIPSTIAKYLHYENCFGTLFMQCVNELLLLRYRQKFMCNLYAI